MVSADAEEEELIALQGKTGAAFFAYYRVKEVIRRLRNYMQKKVRNGG